MSSDVFPLPELTPLIQLNVQDSLRINSERWRVAHQYHHQRQNLHYQSLWLPGIITGLGVRLISPPAQVAANFRQQCWVELQPGLAIDGEGNPIVVPEECDRTYPINIPPPSQAVQTLYLVIRHVDPQFLEISNSTDRIQEQFRIDQRIDALEPKDIELCRVELSPQNRTIGAPHNGLIPKFGELDLRYRAFAHPRSQQHLNLGFLNPNQPYTHAFMALIQGMSVLYPSLQSELCQIELTSTSKTQGLPNTCDCLCLDRETLVEMSSNLRSSQEFKAIQSYAGSLIVVAEQFNKPIEEDKPLEQALRRLRQNCSLQRLSPPHLLTQQPFLFGQLPEIPKGQNFWLGERMIVVPKSILSRWEGQNQTRSELRSWHEFGINLLHFLWFESHIRKRLQ